MSSFLSVILTKLHHEEIDHLMNKCKKEIEKNCEELNLLPIKNKYTICENLDLTRGLIGSINDNLEFCMKFKFKKDNTLVLMGHVEYGPILLELVMNIAKLTNPTKELEQKLQRNMLEIDFAICDLEAYFLNTFHRPIAGHGGAIEFVTKEEIEHLVEQVRSKFGRARLDHDEQRMIEKWANSTPQQVRPRLNTHISSGNTTPDRPQTTRTGITTPETTNYSTPKIQQPGRNTMIRRSTGRGIPSPTAARDQQEDLIRILQNQREQNEQQHRITHNAIYERSSPTDTPSAGATGYDDEIETSKPMLSPKEQVDRRMKLFEVKMSEIWTVYHNSPRHIQKAMTIQAMADVEKDEMEYIRRSRRVAGKEPEDIEEIIKNLATLPKETLKEIKRLTMVNMAKDDEDDSKIDDDDNKDDEEEDDKIDNEN